MKIIYNAPVILTFTFIAVIVRVFGDPITDILFTVKPHFDVFDPLDYLRIFLHVIGHKDWEHLIGNFTFILLLGPLVEEKYGSKDLLIIIIITAVVTGMSNIIFFNTGLIGASGIVFMLILLSSMTNFRSGTIPLTFILVAALYLGKEIIDSLEIDNIAQFAHIIGGISGSVFGFLFVKRRDEGVKNISHHLGIDKFEK